VGEAGGADGRGTDRVAATRDAGIAALRLDTGSHPGPPRRNIKTLVQRRGDVVEVFAVPGADGHGNGTRCVTLFFWNKVRRWALLAGTTIS
jgi:hypothetical protein